MALRLHEDHSGVRDPAPPPQQIRVDAQFPDDPALGHPRLKRRLNRFPLVLV